jgi:hypothetical protein
MRRRSPRRRLTHRGQPLPSFARFLTVATHSWPQVEHRHRTRVREPVPSCEGSTSSASRARSGRSCARERWGATGPLGPRRAMAHAGQPRWLPTRFCGVVCHSWPQVVHRHHSRRSEKDPTRSGSISPFLAGCSSRATTGWRAPSDRPGATHVRSWEGRGRGGSGSSPAARRAISRARCSALSSRATVGVLVAS